MSYLFGHSARAMIAARLKPYYEAQAKKRQRESGGDVRNKTVPEKIPEPRKSRDSRDEAGKAAGGRGFDDLAPAWGHGSTKHYAMRTG
jgi:hypothetical protein